MTNEILVTRRKWVRSPGGVIAGVCESIGRRLGVDPWLIRVLWVVAVAALGTGLLAYVILAVCLPREDRIERDERKKLLGVCRRVALRTGVEVGAVRVMAVLLALVSLGSAFLVYVVLHFALPREGREVIYL